MAGSERLSPLDTMLLWGETPTQHLHVVAVMVMEPVPGVEAEPPYEGYHRRIQERFHLVAPMRQRLQRGPLGAAAWVDDPDIHLDRHLHHTDVGPEGTFEDLAQVVGAVASSPLPRDRPPWETWLVEGLDDDNTAVIAKVHHSAIDGVSGFNTLAALFDLEPNPAPHTAPAWQPEPGPSAAQLGIDAVRELRERPATVWKSVRRVAAASRDMVASRATSPLPLTGPRLPWNRALTARRSTAFTHVPLADVKAVCRAFDVKVNDVVVALATGATREYLAKRDQLPDRPITAGVPVSERAPEHSLNGNRFSGMLYELPIHLEHPVERLLAARRSAEVAKDLYARSGQGLLASAAELVPPMVGQRLARLASGLQLANVAPPLVNMIVSNVRGPAFPLYAAGRKVSHLFPLGPVAEGVGLGLTVVSYCDSIDFGFIACPDLVPDLHEMAGAVEHELVRLIEAAA